MEGSMQYLTISYIYINDWQVYLGKMNLFQRIQPTRCTISYPNFFLSALVLITFLKKEKEVKIFRTLLR
jgi:hypothetical protein